MFITEGFEKWFSVSQLLTGNTMKTFKLVFQCEEPSRMSPLYMFCKISKHSRFLGFGTVETKLIS
jgi:hypothetical protein